jgi:hypothetical protein
MLSAFPVLALCGCMQHVARNYERVRSDSLTQNMHPRCCCTCETGLQDLAARCTCLLALSLAATSSDDRTISRLSIACPRLQILDLSSCQQITDACMSSLTALSALTALRTPPELSAHALESIVDQLPSIQVFSAGSSPGLDSEHAQSSSNPAVSSCAPAQLCPSAVQDSAALSCTQCGSQVTAQPTEGLSVSSERQEAASVASACRTSSADVTQVLSHLLLHSALAFSPTLSICFSVFPNQPLHITNVHTCTSKSFETALREWR